MKSEYELSIKDYIAILKDRAWLLGIVMVVVLAATVGVAISVPPIYQSTGTILVESQQISPDLVSAGNNTFADERIEVIRQRVMTRENLLRIIDKYRLFAHRGSFSESDKIEQMRSAIAVATLSTYVKGRGEATVAFTVSYEDKHADVAKEVADELMSLFLNENMKQRTERATETTEFLTQEANKLGAELASLENQLADFKQAHANALPENQQLRMSMLSRSELEFREVDRDYKAAQEELRYLELELSAANSGAATAPANGRPAAADPQDLPSLKAEYARLLTRYTEAHPDVVAIKRKIDVLQASGEKGIAAAAAGNLDAARVRTKMAAAQSRIASLAEQKRQLTSKMEAYEADILEAPQVERGLVTLMRDHDNARKKYEEIRNKEMGAKITESLEQENKAERFVLLEPPLLPEKPVKPNRKKIVALGLVLAPAAGGGLVMLLEMLNQRVRGVGALESVLGRRVLVAVPYIQTKADKARRKRLVSLLIGAALLLVAILLVVVHMFYMPLDLLLFKAMARFE